MESLSERQRECVIWLGALLSTDGHVEVRGKSRAYTIRAGINDLPWLLQIRKKLLSILNIETSVYGNPRRGYELYLKNPKRITALLKELGLDWVIERKAIAIASGYTAFRIPRHVLIRLKSDPVYFLEKLFGLSLYKYQKMILREIAGGTKTVYIEKGRQIGITFTMTMAAERSCVWRVPHATNHLSSPPHLRFLFKTITKSPM